MVRNAMARGIVMLAGMLIVHATTSLSQEYAPPTYREDPRLMILRGFFEERGSPVSHMAQDFLLAADTNGLDWRLLPSIAVVESGAGTAFRNNNLFGWDNGEQSFPSVRDGIHIVASKLGNSRLYKNKNLDEKLATYNPYPHYRPLVKSVMAQIGAPAIPDPGAVN